MRYNSLVDRAANVGATIGTGCRIKRLSKTSQGWQLDISGGENWRAKILIGADGRNSWVAQQVGMNARVATDGLSIGFQMRLKSSEFAVDRIEIHLLPGGYAGLIGVGDGTVNLAFAIDRRNLPREWRKRFLATEVLVANPYLKAVLERCEVGAELRAAYPVYFSNRRSFADGVLLVGDAARVTEPVTGEGIYFAMRSGMLAAETLDRAFGKGDLSSDCLRSYERTCARALRSRIILNSILRFAIYRAVLIDPLIGLSVNNGRILRALVDAICTPEPAC